MSSSNTNTKVFVTVGSTKFDGLIQTMLSVEVIERLNKVHNTTCLTLQVGNADMSAVQEKIEALQKEKLISKVIFID